MKIKLSFLCVCILLTLKALATGENSFYKGVIVNHDHHPLEVVSIFIFNASDTMQHLYSNTFTNGRFEINFTKKENINYKACILSIGFEDKYMNLDDLKDTIYMDTKILRIADIEIKGKRDIRSSLSNDGGIVYDVANSSLSNLPTSIMMLNFIPGLNANDRGDLSVIGANGEVVIYINNIKLQDKEKLLALKSENIESIEIIRSPGAKYKGAGAVINIKTQKALDGFSSRITGSYEQGEKHLYLTPAIDLSYTKKHITVAGSYRYANSADESWKKISRTIDKDVFAGNWEISDELSLKDKDSNHWYNGNIIYQINNKNTIVAEYTGFTDHQTTNNTSEQIVNKNQINFYKNNILNDNIYKTRTNKAHIFYKGNYSERFSLEANFNFSNYDTDLNLSNRWNENNIENNSTNENLFTQIQKKKATAYTADILLTHSIRKKHSITYGAEYSYLKDDIKSTLVDAINNSTYYYLNSHFIKGIADYKIKFKDELLLTLGVNYMFSRLKDNNSINVGSKYSSVKPMASLQYYKPKKNIGLNLSFEFEDFQPKAGDLNDITITYISPYEISKGNKFLRNTIRTLTGATFIYKKMTIGLFHQYLKWCHTGVTFVENNNGQPLFVNTTANLTNPFNEFVLRGSYNTEISFWTTSIYLQGKYTTCNVDQGSNKFARISGFQGYLSFDNRFKLPHNFNMYLFCWYRSPGISFIGYENQRYNIDLYIEKQFFNNNLNILLKLNGLLQNKYSRQDYKVFGVDRYTVNNFYGYSRNLSLSVIWRFNNFKEVQRMKDNEYLKMVN